MSHCRFLRKKAEVGLVIMPKCEVVGLYVDGCAQCGESVAGRALASQIFVDPRILSSLWPQTLQRAHR